MFTAQRTIESSRKLSLPCFYPDKRRDDIAVAMANDYIRVLDSNKMQWYPRQRTVQGRLYYNPLAEKLYALNRGGLSSTKAMNTAIRWDVVLTLRQADTQAFERLRGTVQRYLSTDPHARKTTNLLCEVAPEGEAYEARLYAPDNLKQSHRIPLATKPLDFQYVDPEHGDQVFYSDGTNVTVISKAELKAFEIAP